VLTGGQINPTAIMRQSLARHGVYVGSRGMFERMNRAIAATGCARSLIVGSPSTKRAPPVTTCGAPAASANS
jgi:hypothetical protein